MIPKNFPGDLKFNLKFSDNQENMRPSSEGQNYLKKEKLFEETKVGPFKPVLSVIKFVQCGLQTCDDWQKNEHKNSFNSATKSK